ncbi:MAG: hypothetical protein COS08_00005, partial [Euryarchaeota archaeon CG01_land_8_20_14_3_00_38_12]
MISNILDIGIWAVVFYFFIGSIIGVFLRRFPKTMISISVILLFSTYLHVTAINWGPAGGPPH